MESDNHPPRAALRFRRSMSTQMPFVPEASWIPPRLSFAARALVNASYEHGCGMRFLLDGDVAEVARALESTPETVRELREYLMAGRARFGGILRGRA